MNILGISAYYHDSSACIVKDGILEAAVQEERLNRTKNSSAFPIQAINFCVQKAGISFNDIDVVAFYEQPYVKFHRVVQDYIEKFPFSFGAFYRNMPLWLQDRLVLPLVLRKEIGFKGRVLFIPHHYSHAASTFFVSPFEEAAIVTADGVGEFQTTGLGVGAGNKIQMSHHISYPDSLGLMYSAFTSYLGFKANSGEGTTMALASFGQASFIDEFSKIVRIADDGSFRLNHSFFPLIKGKRMYSKKLTDLLGEARKPGTEYEQRHKDIAATLQYMVEKSLIQTARHAVKTTGKRNLCMAGGVFLNCVANQKILELPEVDNIFVQPGAGDAGGSVGAAFFVWNQILDHNRSFEMKHAYFGPDFTDREIKAALHKNKLIFNELSDEELLATTVQRIAQGRTVGWFQGRLEFGPRALGNRSILADARKPEMVDVLNHRIKHREWFRPFAPLVKEEKANEYFEMKNLSPFMLLAPLVKPDKRGIIPAVTHIDGTARVQTVSKETNPRLWSLLDVFEKETGVPVIINTSFNLKGEPIVCTPEEAINDYLKSEMDCLVLGNCFIEK
ncbi:MAG TPA: carbamoyltransferase [Bacteroidales bacterium]|nr:carbamoyltransferase [Bacteroidales bacterium]